MTKIMTRVMVGFAVAAALLIAAKSASAQVQIISEFQMGGQGTITLMNIGPTVEDMGGYILRNKTNSGFFPSISLAPCDTLTVGLIDTLDAVELIATNRGGLIDQVPAFHEAINWRYRTAAPDTGFVSEHWVEGHGGIPEFVFPCQWAVKDADSSFGSVKGLFR